MAKKDYAHHQRKFRRTKASVPYTSTSFTPPHSDALSYQVWNYGLHQSTVVPFIYGYTYHTVMETAVREKLIERAADISKGQEKKQWIITAPVHAAIKEQLSSPTSAFTSYKTLHTNG